MSITKKQENGIFFVFFLSFNFLKLHRVGLIDCNKNDRHYSLMITLHHPVQFGGSFRDETNKDDDCSSKVLDMERKVSTIGPVVLRAVHTMMIDHVKSY